MIYGIYNSAAGMMTQEYRQDVIANNLANAETVGFKREIAVISERMHAAKERRSGYSAPSAFGGKGSAKAAHGDPTLSGMTGGVWLGRTETDHSEATIQATGTPTDVAIFGPGFLRVQTGGKELLTRDGRMVVNADGVLVAATDGAPLLSDAGQPIRVNPRGGQISIDETGVVQQDGFRAGRLSVVDVPSYAAMRKVGASRFEAGEQQVADAPALLRSGHVEQSGVQAVSELTRMLEASRAYQMNAQMLTLQDQAAARLISAAAA